MKGNLKIVFSGMIAADPHQGGATWAVLQYLLGFRALGHDVCLIEPVRRKALRPSQAVLGDTENAAYFREVVEQYGLTDHAALLLEGSTETVGLSYESLRKITENADILFNVSGMLQDECLLAGIARRVYLDLDPTFIQLWAAEYGIDMSFDAHNHFVTIGQEIGQPECDVPTCGRDWKTTHQPVVLSEWPVAEQIEHDAFTSIGNWRAYGSAESKGVFYGQKAHSVRDFMDLPSRTEENIILALAIYAGDEKDIDALAANGWACLDPRQVAGTPSDYRTFIQRSKAELGIAKHGYVQSQCGWFSDRSVCYLASGRPVVAQDTGFSRRLPLGEGLLSFSTSEEAASAIDRVRSDYSRHSAAARSIAEDIFDSNKVLPRLLEEVM